MPENNVFETVCPECEYVFKLEDPEKDEVICCDDCGLNLLVRAVDAERRTVVLELTANQADDWGE